MAASKDVGLGPHPLVDREQDKADRHRGRVYNELGECEM